MSSLSVIETKISSIIKYLSILEGFKSYPQKDIEGDVIKKGALERYLYLAVQATLDLAEAVIAFKNFRRPSTYSEFFYILEEENFIPRELSERLINMAKFRNIVAHDYEKVDFSIIYDALQNRLRDIEEFAAKTKANLNL